jgi:hypothetical protein
LPPERLTHQYDQPEIKSKEMKSEKKKQHNVNKTKQNKEKKANYYGCKSERESVCLTSV